jgi:signal peptidase I
MSPTLEPGDRVWADPRAYRDEPPGRGDIVVVRDPEARSRRLIKRVVGVPGDRVGIIGSAIRVLDGGGATSAPTAIAPDPGPRGAVREWAVANGVFVAGDRPDASRDSRTFGVVPLPDVVGRVWYRSGPPGRRGPLGSPAGPRQP